MFSSGGNAWLLLTSLKACDWSGHIFGASARPRFLTKKLAMSSSSTVHGGQHDTKHATFELLLQAAFVSDEIWGNILEPARRPFSHRPPILYCIVHIIHGEHFYVLARVDWFGRSRKQLSPRNQPHLSALQCCRQRDVPELNLIRWWIEPVWLEVAALQNEK